MLSSDVGKLLVAQIGNELAAHQLYLAIAIYFERQSLDRWGKLFRAQAVEEAQHALRIVDFLVDNDVDFDLPALKSAKTTFDSPAAAARQALESERTVARQFDRLASAAVASANIAASSSSSGSSRIRSRRKRSCSTSSTSSRAASTCSRPRPSSTPSGSHVPTSRDDEIRAAMVGELKPLEGPVRLVDYDPAWPVLFEREAARIRSVLGDRVRLLEHAGSTSVPGLAAKPVIDIVLAVPDSAHEAGYVPPLEAARYVLRIREPDWHEHRLLKGPDTDVNLHVFSAACPEIERMLLFRDRLRTDAAERARYERAKRELAARDWQYVQHYADAKGEVVDPIIERARAARSG